VRSNADSHACSTTTSSRPLPLLSESAGCAGGGGGAASLIMEDKGVDISYANEKNQREIIRKRTDIGEHFTREISPEYHIYILTTRRKRAKD